MSQSNVSIVTEYEQLLTDALSEITGLQEKLQQKGNEAIAIVGAGLRFPGGVTSLQEFAALLAGYQDTASIVPPMLWPVDEFYSPEAGIKGKSYTNKGCFIEGVDQFDAGFFGITPREAVAMDPQQRLLLEVCWEALNNAGIAVDSLNGSKTGVYIGLMNHEYAQRIHQSEDLDVYLGTGNAASVASGRISYFLGLQGPSITLDTACSSSLTSVHLACQSLRRGETNLGIAGGANLQLAPYTSIAESAAKMLSPDGKCKAFDDRADGFVRGDGVGLVVLMRLSDAVAEKRPILAIIRGTAVNHDGASSGLTVPNGPAQAHVIRAALNDAGIRPAEVAYVEAHGTGTNLGDPIEIYALDSVYSNHRERDNKLWVGSVKTNIGHTESAAGIAGLLKVVAMLQQGMILPQIHLQRLNQQVEWDQIPIQIATELMPWPEHYQRKIAGVSSFGLGGSNAHIILEQAAEADIDLLLRRSAPFKRQSYWLAFNRIQEPAVDASWIHTIQWNATAKPSVSLSRPKTSWVIFSDSQESAKQLLPYLQSHQLRCSFIYLGSQLAQLSENEWTIQADSPACLNELWSALALEGDLSLLYLWPLNEKHRPCGDYSSQISSQIMPLLYCIQTQANLKHVWLVTQNAMTTGHEQTAIHLAQAALSGFFHVVNDEYPRLITRHIDVDSMSAHDLVKALLPELCDENQPQQVCYRQGDRYTPSLHLADNIKDNHSIAVYPDATYLITGGLGGVGLLVAEWLVSLGAKHLVLVSRHGIKDDETGSRVQKLQHVASIRMPKIDVGDLRAMEELIVDIEQNMPPIAGVIHAAGILADGIISNQTVERFQTVLAPKVNGAWNLHHATCHRQLDFFILFSSISAVLPAPGQSNYAAANAFLDAFAHYRRQQGLTALSINWGVWAVGMAEIALLKKQLNRHQVETIPTETALRVIALLLASGVTQAIVTKHKSGDQSIKTYHHIGSLSLEHRQHAVKECVIRCIAKIIVVDEEQLHDFQAEFQSLGLDSLMAVEIRNELSESLDLTLPVGLVYNYPTLAKLCDFLVHLFEDKPDLTVPSLKNSASSAIAVIGMSCRFPGGANTPEEFWQRLSEGQDCITDMGDKRWKMDQFYDPNPSAPGKIYSRQGGLLDQIDQFDCQFFGITPREAECMDPQQRILLELSWEAIESAGLDASCLQGTDGGVFVGPGPNEYVRICGKNITELAGHVGTGNHNSVTAGRLSYHLGWQGPSMAIDTACSSALVAVHLACQSLRNQECPIALAGGINLMLLPDTSVVLSKSQMLSSFGRCQTFAAGADGYVRAEGAGMLLLKPLEQAEADGDPILAVIRGSAVNQDGHSQGLTAPNGVAQERVIKKALQNAGVKPEAVTYVEAHGTGTRLGDPIEFQALDNVYGKAHSEDNLLWLGSVKTNIGHTEAAAGIAGLIKLILALKHQAIPAHLHLTEENPLLEVSKERTKIPTVLTPWSTNQSRLAAVSSFGFSGTNAHLIVEEWLGQPLPYECHELMPVVLSAKSMTALYALASKYLRFFEAHPYVSLFDVSFTSTLGRMQHPKRVVFLSHSITELCDALRRYTEHYQEPTNGLLNSTRQAIIDQYLRGESVSWDLFYSGAQPHKIVLPTYAFERQRIWPEIKLNNSHSENVLYQQTIAVEEPYPFIDHQLNQEIVVPGAAHITFLIEASRDRDDAGRVPLQFHFKNILFTQPLILDSNDTKQYQLILENKKIKAMSQDGFSSHTHMVAEREDNPSAMSPDIIDLQTLIAPDFTSVPVTTFYQKMQQGGYFLGEHFQWITQLYYRSCEAIAILRAPSSTTSKGYFLPPGLMDSLVQTTALAKQQATDLMVRQELYVPFGMDCIQINNESIKGELICHATLITADKETYTHNLRIYNQDGVVVIRIDNLISKRVPYDKGAYARQSSFAPIVHELSWQETNIKFDVMPESGYWLMVISYHTPIVDEFVGCLKASGIESRVVLAQQLDNANAVERLLNDTPRLTHICFAFGMMGERLIDDMTEMLHYLNVLDISVLLLVQALYKQTPNALPSLSILTNHCQKISLDDRAALTEQATLWGVGRTLQQEHPELHCQLIDMDKFVTTNHLQTIMKLCLNRENGHQFVLRSSAIYVPQIALIKKETLATEQPVLIDERSCYLITGGLGALGWRLCTWLIEQGAREILLVSRRKASEIQLEQITRWKEQGRVVTVKNIDITSRAEVEALLTESPTIKGVIHAAGILDDNVLLNQTVAGYQRVLAPKVQGAWILHQLTHHLDFFILFSSAASILGTKGQANYAAANAFLDYLANYRQGLGLSALSINWGPFADVGMASTLGIPSHHLLSVSLGFSAMRTMMGLPLSQALVMPNMLEFITHKTSEIKPLSQQLQHYSSFERKAYVRELVHNAVCHVLRLTDVDSEQSLLDLGLDSLLAVELRNTLNEQTAETLPVTFIFNYSTIQAITAYLLEQTNPIDSNPIDERQLDELSTEELAESLHALLS